MLCDMHLHTYRNIIKKLLLLLNLSLFIFILSCSKDEENKTPIIQFANDSGFICKDTALIAGSKITVGLNVKGISDNITFLEVIRDNGTRRIFLDSGMNCQAFNYKLSIIKSNDPHEKWIFKVMDRNRMTDSVFLRLDKLNSNQYGKIKTLEDIALSAQDKKEPGSFLSLSTGEAYCLDSAFTRQEIIDIIYYFSEFESTFSSPNESDAPAIFTGPAGLSNWSIKRETRYDTTLVTSTDFANAQNDSLLLSGYEPTTGKRKLKFAKPGMVVSFISPAGKIGLLSVKETQPGPEGYIKFSVKIQE